MANVPATNEEGTVEEVPTPRSGSDRRQGAPEEPIFGGLLAEAGWEPVGPAADAHEGWIRHAGLAPDRRATPRDRRAS